MISYEAYDMMFNLSITISIVNCLNILFRGVCPLNLIVNTLGVIVLFLAFFIGYKLGVKSEIDLKMTGLICIILILASMYIAFRMWRQ